MQLLAVLIMVLFFATVIITTRPYEKLTPPPPHPGYEPAPEYWQGVPLSEMGLELIPYCEPIQVTDGPANKRIPAIAMHQASLIPDDFAVHVIWSEPTEGAREIWECYGPVGGGNFSEKRLVTKPDGYRSYNQVAISGEYNIYLGYMDESVNTREIWFKYGDIKGWSEPEIVSNENIDSRSWGANPIIFCQYGLVTELPLMLWFDHRYTKHEIFLKARQTPFPPFLAGEYDARGHRGWDETIRVTNDDWFQFDPHADWSSSFKCCGFEGNAIHLVYMDSRYGKQEDKHEQHEGNGEIFYRTIKPKGPLYNLADYFAPVERQWEIGEEVQLSFTPGLSDLPRVAGKRFPGNSDLDTAWVVWHELDVEAGTGIAVCCEVKDGKRGKLHRINPPGTVGVNPEIITLYIPGFEDLKAMAYQQYGENEQFPVGKANIYIRILNGDKISEPIKISDSKFTCSYPRMSCPIKLPLKFKIDDAEAAKPLVEEPWDGTPFCTAWDEYRGVSPDLAGESQIFFRSFYLRKAPQWPPESQTYRKRASGMD